MTVIGDQHIGSLEVTVDDPSRVEESQRVSNFLELGSMSSDEL